MKKTDSMREMILIKKLKAEDPIELPMDQEFFDNLHNKIMLSVDKTEVKPVSKWTKTWVFLEKKTLVPRAKAKKVVRLGITATTIATGVGLLNFGLNLSTQMSSVQVNLNKSSILSEAKRNPVEWSELAVNYQDENDFYADILSQALSHNDLGTIVEIDKVIAQSL